MAKRLAHISFDEFARQLEAVFDSLAQDKEPILVERRGELYQLAPAALEVPRNALSGYDPERARQALRDSAGALAGVDRAALLADLHEQRKQASHGRPG